MMKNQSQTQSIKIFSRTSPDKISLGSIEVKNLSQKDKVIESLKWLLKFWGLSLCFLFVPLAHFLLTPLFFILGIVFSTRQLGIKTIVLRGSGSRPLCQTKLNIQGGALRPEIHETCSKCLQVLVVRAG